MSRSCSPRLAPSRAGLTRDRIEDRAHRDGLVVPLAAGDTPPAPPEIEANDDPGISAVESHVESGAPLGVGAATGGAPGAQPAPAASHPAPPRLRAPAAAAPPPTRPDAYKLRLISSRTLYDNGAFVQESDALTKLTAPAELHVHPSDINRFSLSDGGLVRVTSSRSTTTLTVVADLGLPRGACWLAFNVGSTGAADLIDAADPVTDLAVESA